MWTGTVAPIPNTTFENKLALIFENLNRRDHGWGTQGLQRKIMLREKRSWVDL